MINLIKCKNCKHKAIDLGNGLPYCNNVISGDFGNFIRENGSCNYFESDIPIPRKESKLFSSKDVPGMLTDGQGGYYPMEDDHGQHITPITKSLGEPGTALIQSGKMGRGLKTGHSIDNTTGADKP